MYGSILAAIRSALWVITPEKLSDIVRLMDLRSRGMRIDPQIVSAVAAESRARREASVSRSVAVLPVLGVITQRAGLIEEASGLASTDSISRDFRRLMADDTIGAVILDVDSPGGTSYGVPELAAEILAARGQKPIVAVANAIAGSAAYWIASAADELVVTPSGYVGSIGAYVVHWDESGLNENIGVKATYIRSAVSEYKAEGVPEEPLSDSAKEELQARVNELGEWFAKSVAKHRGVTSAKVKADFGKGRMVSAEEAVRRGMADRVATLGETIGRVAGGKPARGGRRVETAGRNLELRAQGY